MMPQLILLIGLPASGKSTLARQIISQDSGCLLISTDAIRAELFGDEAIQGPWLQVWSRVQQEFEEAVVGGFRVVYDATNVRRKQRQEAIARARKTGFTHIIGCWLDVPLEICLQRNTQRQRQVPEEVIFKMYRQLTDAPPSLEEGLDKLVRVDGQKDFSVLTFEI